MRDQKAMGMKARKLNDSFEAPPVEDDIGFEVAEAASDGPVGVAPVSASLVEEGTEVLNRE